MRLVRIDYGSPYGSEVCSDDDEEDADDEDEDAEEASVVVRSGIGTHCMWSNTSANWWTSAPGFPNCSSWMRLANWTIPHGLQ